MVSLRQRIVNTFCRKQHTESTGESSQPKPLRLRGGCISTRSLDDPNSKHYNHYSQNGFEIWGSSMGNRLESLGRTISRGAQHSAQQVIHHHHHHYHYNPNDQHHGTSQSQIHPQHVFRGWGGSAADGFEHSKSDMKK